MALFPIGASITSIYLGKAMKSLGRKNVIEKGGKLLSFSFFLFAISMKIKNYLLFVFCSMVSRFL